MRALFSLLAASSALSAQAAPPQSVLAPRPPQSVVAAASTFAQLRDEAIRESKPLVVWIGYRCPSSANQLPGFVHHHAGASWEGVSDQGVIVYVPKGDGFLYNAGFIGADECCAANMRAAVERTLSGWERSAQQMQAAPAFKHVRGWVASRDGNCVG